MGDELMDVAEAAEVLGVTSSRVRQICRTGSLGQMVGSRWLIRRDELDAYAKTRRPAGRPPQTGEGDK